MQRRKFRKIRGIVAGGRTRQQSSRLGIRALATAAADDWVLIHDAARPLINSRLIDRCLAALKKSAAVVPAVSCGDTMAQIGANHRVVQMPERTAMVALQTPQGFHLELIRRAHELAAKRHTLQFNDDSGLVWHWGLDRVTVIAGEEQNIKITLPQDWQLAELLLLKTQGQAKKSRKKEKVRISHGE